MKDLIIANIEDLVSNFLYYDRKEDEDLSVEQLNSAIKSGEITLDEIADIFKSELQRRFK